MTIKVGFILSGAGVFDGAELHESVLCLLALGSGGCRCRLYRTG